MELCAICGQELRYVQNQTCSVACGSVLSRLRRRRVYPKRTWVGIDMQLEDGPSGTGAAAECMELEGSVL